MFMMRTILLGWWDLVSALIATRCWMSKIFVGQSDVTNEHSEQTVACLEAPSSCLLRAKNVKITVSDAFVYDSS
jgi:hypothetical protein